MRKFNTRKILLIVGAVLFTVLFVFSGFMALRQYRDTKQSAEAFNWSSPFPRRCLRMRAMKRIRSLRQSRHRH